MKINFQDDLSNLSILTLASNNKKELLDILKYLDKNLNVWSYYFTYSKTAQNFDFSKKFILTIYIEKEEN